MKKIFLFLLSWSSFLSLSFGQQSDSLFHLLDTFNLEKKSLIAAYEDKINEVGDQLSVEDLIKCYKRGLNATQEIQYDTLARIFADNLLRMYLSQNDMSNVEKYAIIALDHTKKIGNKRLIAYQYITLATSYLGNDDMTKAIEYLLKVVEISKKYQEASEYEYHAYMSLGFSFYRLGEIEQSMSYLRSAEKYHFKNDDDFRNLYLAHIYSGISGNHLEMENKDSSEFYINETLLALQRVELDTSLNLIHIQSPVSDIYFDIIEYYLSDNRLSEANVFYEKIKDFQTLDQERKYLVDIRFSLQRNQLEKVRRLIDTPPDKLILIYELEYLALASEYYEKIGDYKKSFSLFKKKNEKEIEQLKVRQIKFSSFTKEKIESLNQKGKIETLTQEKIYQSNLTKTLIVLTLVMIFSIILLVYAFYQVRLKNKLLNKNIEDEKKIKIQSQKLQQIEQQKNILFTNIAHEFQTPLNIIQGLSKYIVKSNQLSDDGYEALKILNRNSTSLSESTKQILTVNLPDNKRIPSNKKLFSLTQLFEYILPEYIFLAERKSINIEWQEVSNSTINIYSDLNKVSTIIKNVLSNAIKYTSKDGMIRIKCSSEDKEYDEIIIEDNGKGISEEELPFIFDRYYQSSKEAEGGFGLGLSICQDYIRSLNGKIEVKSRIGKGSSFSIQLPKFETESLSEQVEFYCFAKNDFPKPQLKNKEFQKLPTEKNHILIVEDNIDFCKYLEIILQDEFNLAFVHNGSEALEYLQNNTPTLVITDWMMIGVDGLTLVENLKSTKEFNHLPVLMLTARSLTSDKIKALRAGVDDYLIKPISDDLLISRINYLISIRAQRGELKLSFPSTVSNEEGLELSQSDEDWLFEMEKIIFPLIQNFDLNLEKVAKLGHTNVTQLNRKLKLITGLTAKKYIQEIRYWEARRMLETKEHDSVKAICLSVGFKDQKNFSRKFKERFGLYPSEYLQSN